MTSRDWKPSSSAPIGEWIRTRREGEDGENVCAYWVWPDRTEEWEERATGVTTITHHSFAPPTHWDWLEKGE